MLQQSVGSIYLISISFSKDYVIICRMKVLKWSLIWTWNQSCLKQSSVWRGCEYIFVEEQNSVLGRIREVSFEINILSRWNVNMLSYIFYVFWIWITKITTRIHRPDGHISFPYLQWKRYGFSTRRFLITTFIRLDVEGSKTLHGSDTVFIHVDELDIFFVLQINDKVINLMGGERAGFRMRTTFSSYNRIV